MQENSYGTVPKDKPQVFSKIDIFFVEKKSKCAILSRIWNRKTLTLL